MIWIGDDWAEDHHDVEILDEDGRRLARARLPRAGRHHPAAYVDRGAPTSASCPRPGTGGRAGRDRDRDRSRHLGAGAARGRLSGLCDQPDVVGPVSGAAFHLGCEVRRRGCSRAGRDRASGPRPPPAGRRRQPDRRSGETAGPSPPEFGLGSHPPGPATAIGAAGILPPPPCQAFDDLAARDALELLDRAPTRTRPPACPG